MLPASSVNTKAALLLLMLFITVFAYSQSQTTIIDTIWTENSLQGGIGYHVQNGTYYGGIVPVNQDVSEVGDSWDPYGDLNDICIRSYFSFPIMQIPEQYTVDNIEIFVYQTSSIGNDQPGFPNWYNQQYIPCYLYHIDYGLTFEPIDFNPVVFDTVGVIFADAQDGWKTLAVTNAYLCDYNSNRPYLQLMFMFPILTDYDQSTDSITFENSYGGIYAIRLVITYSSTSTDEDETLIDDNEIKMYPNPIHDNLTIFKSPDINDAQFDIYNIKGQKVYTQSLPKTSGSSMNIHLDRNTLKAGLYFIRIHYLKKNEPQSIIKKVFFK